MRIISGKEVVSHWEDWLPALDSEVNSLLKEKEAFQSLDKTGYDDLKSQTKEGRSVEELPSKMVWTLKPGPSAKGKRTARWVMCRSYEAQKGHETYSGGADATAFRVMITKAAIEQWTAATLDIKTAFLNADMEVKEGENVLVVRPRHVLVSEGYFKSSDVFLPLKAVYGLKRSPRLWGKHRGKKMMEIVIETGDGTVILRPLQSEPNLWKIIPLTELTEETDGTC